MNSNQQLSPFFKILNQTSIPENNIRWRISDGDSNFFKECLSKLLEYNVKSILDISCGKGEFVNLALDQNIEAYGIDPLLNDHPNIHLGSFDSIIKNQNYLNNFKFDCITIHNTLHGKYHQDEELKSLLSFIKVFSKYFVISSPINLSLIKDFKCIHEFNPSHGNKSVHHKLYVS